MMRILFTTILVAIASSMSIYSYAQELWGVTYEGGDSNIGTIFRTDMNGDNHSVESSFLRNDGGSPYHTQLCEASNGKLYGLTMSGGLHNKGVLFEYDPVADTYLKKIDFNGSNNGNKPQGSLIEASNGKLYGLTYYGGSSDKGVLFEYDPATNTCTKKVSFDGTNGKEPNGSLVEADNGNLYGYTYLGGSNNKGVLFEYNVSTEEYTKKIDFGGDNGENPKGSLVQATDGKLYGSTSSGGANGSGVLFEYVPSTNTYTKKIDFESSTYGSSPTGGLAEGESGKLYGLTSSGGANGQGVIFEFNTSSSILTKKFDFDDTNSGRSAQGKLIKANDGKFYGVTARGGSNGEGVMFEYDPSTDTYTKKLDFETANGIKPYGSLMQATDGKLYGLTYFGGTNNIGVLFQYDLSTDTYIRKVNFGRSKNGNKPYGGLVKASNHKFYGMAAEGGDKNKGVLFEYSVSGTYIKKVDFDGSNSGSTPYGSLVEAANEKLYGLTYTGGSSNKGVLFEYDPSTDTYTKKLDFNGSNNGAKPRGSLIQASNGKLYGLTQEGGDNNEGVLFEYDLSTDTYTKKLDFDEDTHGGEPLGTLFEASNGKLYGLTRTGGSNNKGTLFEYDLSTDSYTKKFDFDGTNNGSNPSGSLIEAANGKLYGFTQYGGANEKGVIFEYTASTNTYTKIFDFDGDNGREPFGALLEASNGMLYGSTPAGGSEGLGVLFEYNISTSTFTKKLDFDGINGSKPYGVLIESASCDVSSVDLTVDVLSPSILKANQNGATYKWLDCNNNFTAIPAATNQTFIVPADGSYAVEVTLGECVYTSACQSMTITSIDDYRTVNDFSIFPNPTNSFVKVDLGINNEKIHYTVTSLNGKVVEKGNTELNSIYIDFTNKVNGVYLIRLDTKDSSTVYKLIKQ